MNRTKTALLLAALIGSALIAGTADAQGRYRHHHHRSSVGIFIGAPLLYSGYYYSPYYSPYYYPPAVVVPAPAPPVYIEQSSTPPAAPAPSAQSQARAGYWYYCRDTQTYYPYVQQCASPWQQVAPQSAPPS